MPAKKPTLQDVLADLKAKQKIAIGSLSDFNMVPEGLSTGNIAIDTITGIGGFPKGRVTELFGPPSSGKTTAAIQAAGNFQEKGGIVFYADWEGTLDEGYCKNLGMQTEGQNIVYMQPDTFEQGANAFRKILATGEVGLFIADSVATMVTQAEKDADTGQAMVAERAKMMAQFLRQTISEYRRTNCAAIFLNHLMELLDTSPMGRKLSSQGIKRKTTPGGTALPFYSSLRMEFRQIGNLRSQEVALLSGHKEDQIRQTKTQATVVKNKVGDPFGTAELRVRFGKGFSQPYSVFRILVDYGVITRSEKGGKYTFPDNLLPYGTIKKNYIVGEDEVLKAVEEDPAWLQNLQTHAEQLLAEHGPQTVDGSQYDENGLEEDEASDALSVLDSDELTAAMEATP